VKEKSDKVVIIPCSGIGKPFGSVSREAAYQVTEESRPDNTRLVALSKLVLGDEESKQMVMDNPAITIDGCKLACASKVVKECGGRISREFNVLDLYRQYRELKPKGIAELNEDGQKLALAMAGEIEICIDACCDNHCNGRKNHG
jgi:uncharacterized metal-binding protein